jgi:hypothetical protein
MYLNVKCQNVLHLFFDCISLRCDVQMHYDRKFQNLFLDKTFDNQTKFES